MPATGKHALVQINSVYLSKNGLVGGIPCQTEIGGLDALAVSDAIEIIKALDGTPYMQVTSPMKGKPISIGFNQMEESVYDSIVAIIQAYVTSSTAITLNITNSPYGTFTSIAVIPDVNPVRHAHEFQGTALKNGSFHFLKTAA
jgi:hypothetical protein